MAFSEGAAKPRERGGLRPVDGVGRPREGRRAERAAIHARPGVAHATAVALQGPGVGEPVVAQEDGLAALQVRVPRHQHVLVGLGPIDQRGHDAREGLPQPGQAIGEPQPHVGGDLVVAGPGGVQLLAHLPDPLDEAVLDGEVDVLELGARAPGAGGDLVADGVEPCAQGARFVVGQQPHDGEHLRVGLAAGDVLGAPSADRCRSSCRRRPCRRRGPR